MARQELERDPLCLPAQYVKGVGPARARQLSRLGVYTVEDLLYHLPRRYEDRSNLTPIRNLVHGKVETTQGTVASVGDLRPRHGLTITKAAIVDQTGVAYAVWYNQPYIKQMLRRGMEVVLTGKVERRFGEIQIQNPEFEVLEGDEEDLLHTGRIVPIYPSTEGLSQRTLRTILYNALNGFVDAVPEILPDDLRGRLGLLGIREALRKIHFPSSEEEHSAARRRLAFEELFLLQLVLLLRKQAMGEVQKGIRYRQDGDLLQRFIESLPYPLTGAQRRVIAEVAADMQSPHPMNRLIQGDVGSGKTIIAAAALVLCVQGGYQGALMAPTEILAGQHYLTLKPLLEPLGIRIALLVGGMEKDERESVLSGIASGEVDIVVGTHALIQEDVAFARLGLVVVDEQHKFGVMQRARLRRKGFYPDVIVMTATPIPRTLALTLYGDLDISLLDESPPGRQPVATYWRRSSSRGKVYAFCREQVQQGRQVYVVCPLVEESEKLEAKAALEMAERLAQTELRGLRIGVLHGRMSLEEKERVMRSFRNGDLDVLVSTTVIEVGIDVPNATVMVIEDADRFGLAQLHQLRGRVGRGPWKSSCILIADPTTEEGRRRMEIMERTSDGFVIAQEDLLLRGPGELFGTRQHGLPDLRVANLLTDLAILEEARREAQRVLQEDPTLEDPRNRGLRLALEQRFKGHVELVSVS